MPRKRSDEGVEARRTLVSQLVLAGLTRREIADQLEALQQAGDLDRRLGTSYQTVQRDVETVRERWRADAIDNVGQHYAMDLRRVEMAIGGVWSDVVAGDYEAIRAFVMLLRRKADMLGYDRAERGFGVVVDNRQQTLVLTQDEPDDIDLSDREWVAGIARAIAGTRPDVARESGSRALEDAEG